MNETAAKVPDFEDLLASLEAFAGAFPETDSSVSSVLDQSLSSGSLSSVKSQDEAIRTTSRPSETESPPDWRTCENNLRKGSSKRRTPALKFPPCIICGGKASGLHFGCNTCEACKNFFRRYSIRKKHYICNKENDCHISYTNKSNCSACRLAKCYQQGMCKSKSKLGRYSYDRRTQTINLVKELEQSNNSNTNDKVNDTAPHGKGEPTFDASTIPSGVGLVDASKPYDKDLVDELTQAMKDIKVYDDELENEEVRNAKCKEHYERLKLKADMFGSMNAVSMEEYQTLLKKYGIDLDGQYEAFCRLADVYKDMGMRFYEYIKKIPRFSQLSCNDQSNLLVSNSVFAFSILLHQGCSEQYDVFLQPNGEACHTDESAERIFSRHYLEEMGKFYYHLKKLALTKEEMSLLTAIATFSSDSCNKLDSPELVDKLQLDCVDLLSQHVHTVYERRSAAASRLTKLLDCLVRIREPVHIYFQEIKRFKGDPLMVKPMPYIEDLLTHSALVTP